MGKNQNYVFRGFVQSLTWSGATVSLHPGAPLSPTCPLPQGSQATVQASHGIPHCHHLVCIVSLGFDMLEYLLNMSE